MSEITVNKEEWLWATKYRPKKVQECIMPKEYKDLFQAYVDKGEIPMLLLSSPPGQGKTTMAMALCDQIGADTLFINASMENGIDVLRNKIQQFASTVSMEGGAKVVILDESDMLNANSIQPAMRAFLETFSKNCRFIFTANYPNKLIEPLRSRLTHIEFKISADEKPKLLAQMFARVCEILNLEGIEYDKKVVAQFVGKHFPDNRKILNELQRYSISGRIDSGILVNAVEDSFGALIKTLKDKDYKGMRDWVAKNSDVDIAIFVKTLYNMSSDKVKPQSIPQLVLTLADYQYKAAFAADPEVNIAALCTELMVQCEFL